MKSSTRIAFIILAAVGFGAIVVLATLLLRPYSYHGMTFQSSQPAKDFILTGPDGRPVSLSDYRGKLVALYFGYTFCPDVCPTTLAELGQAVKQLGPKAEEIQVLMVTVDPERDTPERLAEYVSYFNPAFVIASPTKEGGSGEFSHATPLPPASRACRSGGRRRTPRPRAPSAAQNPPIAARRAWFRLPARTIAQPRDPRYRRTCERCLFSVSMLRSTNPVMILGWN